jgi:hypothetical protein
VNGFADAIDKLYHPLEKLGANAAAFGTIIDFELNLLDLLLLFQWKVIPPILKGIDNKITGFCKAAKHQVQLAAILIDNPTGNILLTRAKIMVTSSPITSGLTPTSEIPNVDRSFAVHAQSFDTAVPLSVMGVDVLEDGVCFWNFF